MRARLRIASILGLLSPCIGTAQTLPCGECYDYLPQQPPASVYELLPGGDDPRRPTSAMGMPLSIPRDAVFDVGATISGLRGMNTAQGTRSLILLNGRRVAIAPFAPPCTGSAIGSLTETVGGIEWRITGCTDSASEDGALSQLRIEEARPSTLTPRYFRYARSASGNYRLVEVGDPRELQVADAAFDALSALTPAELRALEQRLREGARSE